MAKDKRVFVLKYGIVTACGGCGSKTPLILNLERLGTADLL